MNLEIQSLRRAEAATLRLRGLYESYGYRKYRMGRFEEYSLYAANKSFLLGENVPTFTDLDGRLMALKPDVTLSIAKNTKADKNTCEKVYYLESVYRESKEKCICFLHYFPLDGDMINSDFKYELIKIATSFWKNSVAVMDMPKQEVEKIEFGQYYGDTRFWERTIETSSFISRPKMLYLSDYTDNDWNCGYSNLENCFLINNLDLENYYIKGKELQGIA